MQQRDAQGNIDWESQIKPIAKFNTVSCDSLFRNINIIETHLTYFI